MGTNAANTSQAASRSEHETRANPAARERFSAEEMVICLSHYDLGVIRSVRDFARGSRRAPKAAIESEKGKFLFKRRAHGRDDVAKVTLVHQLQTFLSEQTFPLPRLIHTRDDHSMLVRGGFIYEMFEFIEGSAYGGSLISTYEAGHTLGLFHKLLAAYRPAWPLPLGSYHDAKAILQSIRHTVRSLPPKDRPPGDVVAEAVEGLAGQYEQCARVANELGVNDWEVQVVHGDWHPGNMLFRKEHVAAAIDYDAARFQPRVIDLANGALQFSIAGGGRDPEKWPDAVDMARFTQFFRGYDAANVITVAEIQAIPYLMCEAMIAEAVLPIAATGSFGRIDGFPFLQMIRRKVCWVQENRETLVKAMQEA